MPTQRLPNITEEMWDDAFQALLALRGYLSVTRDHEFVYPMEVMNMAHEAVKAILGAGYKPRDAEATQVAGQGTLQRSNDVKDAENKSFERG